MGGKSDKITGRIKEAVGVLTENDNLQREGQRDQVLGEVKEQASQGIRAPTWSPNRAHTMASPATPRLPLVPTAC